jgi:molybdopterin converting factor small subunit
MAQVVVAGDTVAAVVDELETQFPGIRQRLCRGDSLAPGLQVSVDSTVTLRGLRSRLQPGSEVHFLPVRRRVVSKSPELPRSRRS